MAAHYLSLPLPDGAESWTDRALRYCTEAADDRPDLPRALYGRAWVLMHLGKESQAASELAAADRWLERAEADVRRALTMNHSSRGYSILGSCCHTRATVAHDRGRLEETIRLADEAIAAFMSAERAEPGFRAGARNVPSVLLSRAEAEATLGRDPIPTLEEGLRLTKELVQRRTRAPITHLHRAQLLQARAELAPAAQALPYLLQAVEAAEAGIALAPDLWWGWVALEQTHLKIASNKARPPAEALQDLERQAEALEQVVRLMPDDWRVQLDRASHFSTKARLLRILGRDPFTAFAQAKAILDEWIVKKPDAVNLRAARGLLHQRIAAAHPPHGTAYVLELDAAVKDLAAAAKMRPDQTTLSQLADARTRFAQTCVINKRPDLGLVRRSIQDFTNCIERWGAADPAWHSGRGAAKYLLAQLQQKGPERKRQLLEEAIADHHVAIRGLCRVNLGMALAMLGRRDAAIAAFEEALRLDPTLQPRVAPRLDRLRKSK
ncbi:MAG: tetratricopeptide repeat protein [Planctomycetota bacterium]|jgi:tetratricopeptide (TPR) repeat protein